MVDVNDGRDWMTRRLGKVQDFHGNRLSVSWDPKCGGPNVRFEGDAQYDCEGDDPDEDGWCREPQVLVLNLTPDEADQLWPMIRAAAEQSRAFFARGDGA